MEKINALSNSNVILPGVSGGGNYYTYSVIVGDVANEGLLDMVVGHHGNQNQLLMLENMKYRVLKKVRNQIVKLRVYIPLWRYPTLKQMLSRQALMTIMSQTPDSHAFLMLTL